MGGGERKEEGFPERGRPGGLHSQPLEKGKEKTTSKKSSSPRKKERKGKREDTGGDPTSRAPSEGTFLPLMRREIKLRGMATVSQRKRGGRGRREKEAAPLRSKKKKREGRQKPLLYSEGGRGGEGGGGGRGLASAKLNG